MILRVYARTITNTPAATAVWFVLADENGINLLQVTETGQVWLGAEGVGVDKGNAGPLTTAYQRWEFRFLVDNAAGLLDVRVDGVSMVSDSGIDTRLGAVDTVGQFWLGNVSAAGQDSKDFDDIAVNDTLGIVSTSWPGPGSVLGDSPDADGANLDWTPSAGVTHYDLVNSQNDATGVDTDTPGAQDTYEFPDIVNPGHNGVVALALWVRAMRAGGAATVSHLYRQAGTDWVLPAFTLTAAWDWYGYHTSENPIYGGMLTRGIFNAAEYGIKAIT